MANFSATTIANEAMKAGYRIPSESTEDLVRREVAGISNAEEAENHLFTRISEITSGVNLSPDEAIHFLEGVSLEEILAARWHINGDITASCELSREGIAATQVELSGSESSQDEFDGRETAYCLSCRRVRPITFGYVGQPSVGAIVDLGGPVDAVRVLNNTEEQTFCAVCGHRVYTDAEIRESEIKEDNEKFIWGAIGILALLVVVAIGAMIVSVS